MCGSALARRTAHTAPEAAPDPPPVSALASSTPTGRRRGHHRMGCDPPSDGFGNYRVIIPNATAIDNHAQLLTTLIEIARPE